MKNDIDSKKDYGIKMTREYDEVVDNMCNISGYYTQDYEDAVAKLMKANDTIAEKDNEIAEKDSMIAEKDNEIAELRARVQAFENSR